MKSNASSHRPHFIIALAAVALLILSQLTAGAKSPSDRQRASDAAKARDLYLEAMQYMAMDDPDACASLLRYAYSLNPDDPEIKAEYGFILAVTSAYLGKTGDTTGLDMMRQAVLADPSNTERGLSFLSTVAKLPGVSLSAAELLPIISQLYSAAADRSVIASAYATMLRNSNNADSIRKSIGILDSLEYAEGFSQETTTAKAQAYANLGDTLAALAEIRSLYTKYPDNSDYLLLLAGTFDMFEQSDSAAYWYDRGITLFPDLPDFHMRKALWYVQRDDSTGLSATLARAMQIPDLDHTIKQQMLQYFAQTYYDGRIYLLRDPMEALVASYPDDYDAHIDYALVVAAAGDTITALAQLAEARRLDPSVMRGYSVAANLHNEAGQLSKAVALVKEGMQKTDDDMALGNYLIYLYLINERYSDALPIVNGLIKDVGDFDIEKALSLRNDTIDEYTTDEVPADSILQISDFADDVDDALIVESDSMAIEDEYLSIDTLTYLGDLYIQRADIYWKLGKIKQAIPDYELAIRILPDNWLPYNNYSYMLAESSIQLDKALQLAEKSMELVDSDPEGHTHFTSIGDTYAWVLYRRGELLRAKELIDQVLEADSELSAEVLDHAGDIYQSLGLREEAQAFWQQALELEPDNTDISRKLRNE